MSINGPLIDSPGHFVRQQDGGRAWLADQGVLVVEDRLAGVYRVTVDDLDNPVLIPVEDITQAAAGVPNLIAARLHDARKAQALHRELTCLDDPLDEALGRMLVGTLRVWPDLAGVA